jgi:hypothetical protein
VRADLISRCHWSEPISGSLVYSLLGSPPAAVVSLPSVFIYAQESPSECWSHLDSGLVASLLPRASVRRLSVLVSAGFIFFMKSPSCQFDCVVQSLALSARGHTSSSVVSAREQANCFSYFCLSARWTCCCRLTISNSYVFIGVCWFGCLILCYSRMQCCCSS